MPIPTIAVSGVNLPFIEYQGQPVVTYAMIDAAHNRPSGTAKNSFSRNKQHLIENEDFYVVDLKSEYVLRTRYPGLFPEMARKIIFFTETGYLMLVKPFTDALAWKVQRQLVKSYFRTKPSQQVATAEPREPVVISIEQREEMAELLNFIFGKTNYTGHNRTYNRLRIRYNLRRIDDLPAEHFDEAMASIRAKIPEVKRFIELKNRLFHSFHAEVIGEGEPLTAWLARQAGGAQHIPAKPDWKAISYQILRHQGLLPRQ